MSQTPDVPPPATTPKPPLGVCRRVRVVEVVDGDTITVEMITRARVRLLDCWAPETRTRDDREKAAGLAAKQSLFELAYGREGVIYIDLQDAGRVDDAVSLGRVIARVWLDGMGDVDLSAAMVAAGHAATTKEALAEQLASQGTCKEPSNG